MQTAVDAARHPPAEPAPDPLVSAAFALGWQMAELYRPGPGTSRPPAATDDLPGLARLTEDERAQISLKQVDAALTKLGGAVSAAGLPALDVGAFTSCLTPGTDPAVRKQSLRELHVQLLSTLTAADFRLGKAYGLGRSLADTCRSSINATTLQEEFKPNRIATLRSWLHDLASALPAHAGRSVSDSLDRWMQAVTASGNTGSSGNQPQHLVDLLPRQGQLWRSLLSAEKAGTDMLDIAEYVDAANRLVRTARRLVRQVVVRSPLLVVAIVALFAGGVFLMLNQATSASIVAGAGGILASVGLTWKSVGAALGGIGAKVEQQLWGAELDTAIANAITLVPAPAPATQGASRIVAVIKRLLPHRTSQRLVDRQQFAKDAVSRAALSERQDVPTAALRPELLAPVLDPQQLLGKLNQPGGIRDRHVTRSAELSQLPSEQRLPPGHLDQLSVDIEAEKNDPHRVIRAQSPSAEGGPTAPPPVIYLSRKPTVSQFMGVVTQCFEAELQGPALQRLEHLHNLDELWRDVERFAEDLRSRFRRFGPCDVRFLEPKLAQVLAGFLGKHAFANAPAEVRLAENAKVVIFGDWATALPQARNVAAQIKAKLAAVESGIECHVIHLGDTYYSGLEDECRRRFLDQWPVDSPATASSWTLAGNHDMYAGGHGYFDVLLADPRFAAQRRCSYFALANDHWQILGLDSAYKDPDIPDLQDPQGDWLAGAIRDRGTRRTVLLTHHQPFSAYEEVNTPLAGTVAAALNGVTLDAWLWGHEHRCAVYQPEIVAERYQANANYTAIVGHGGVPNLLSAQSAGKDQDAIEWEFADAYQVEDDRWGLGGFAVLSFTGPRLEIQYYDEYGKTARAEAKTYPAGEASLEQVSSAGDERSERPAYVVGERLPQRKV
ncbi:MAG TPA: metallophosphoesterase [Solirubrobacteraceae bacterium]|nr:metallophosphoesterase [Solirubrobacteraceae bacterium]